jgi:hypothetical protein
MAKLSASKAATDYELRDLADARGRIETMEVRLADVQKELRKTKQWIETDNGKAIIFQPGLFVSAGHSWCQNMPRFLTSRHQLLGLRPRPIPRSSRANK